MKAKKALILASTAIAGAACLAVSLKGVKTNFLLSGAEDGSWRHYSAIAADSCGTVGMKEYWTNCKGTTVLSAEELPAGAHVDEYTSTAADLAAIRAKYGDDDSRVIVNKHAYGADHQCSKCGGVEYSAITGNVKQELTISADEAPRGFNYVFDCAVEAGGNPYGNYFFVSGAKLGLARHYTFAVKGNFLRMHPKGATDSTSQRQFVNNPDTNTWTTIDARSDNGNDWVITSSAGQFKEYGGSGLITDDIKAKTTTNDLNDILRFYTSGEFKITEVIASDDAKTTHEHTSSCGHTVLDYTEWLQNPEKLSETTWLAPEGFEKVYYYDGTTGGGTTGGFYKHAGGLGLASWESGAHVQKYEVAVYSTSAVNFKVRNNAGGAQNAMAKPENANVVGGFVRVTFTLNAEGDGFVCTNDRNDTSFTCDRSNSLFGIAQLLCDSAFYVTESVFYY